MNLLRDHFNELLLALLALVFTGLAIFVLAKEGWAAADGFKWISGEVGTVLGALLALLMKQGPKPEAKP